MQYVSTLKIVIKIVLDNLAYAKTKHIKIHTKTLQDHLFQCKKIITRRHEKSNFAIYGSLSIHA